MIALRTRRPTGAASWPRVLLSGEEGTEAAWLAAEFTGDERLATTYWLEIEPGSTGDVYAAAPGASYELLDHDGTWEDIYAQLDAAWHVAREAAEEGLPTALVVNSMSGVWSMLSRLADQRARRRTAADLTWRGLDGTPAYSSDVEVEIKADLWTLIGRRHDQFMGKILTWPGPVILTAREKRGTDGKWQLKAQDQFAFQVNAWIRLARGEQPEIVSLLSPQRYRLSSTQRRALRAKFTLSTLVWDWSGVTPDTGVPAVRVLDADQVMPHEQPPVRSVKPSGVQRRGRTAATVTPIAAEPGPDAEIGAEPPATPTVPTEPPATPAEPAVVDTLARRWLVIGARDQVQNLYAETESAGPAALAADVSELLTEHERKALGADPDKPFTLRDLSTNAARLVFTTGMSLRTHDAPQPHHAAGVA